MSRRTPEQIQRYFVEQAMLAVTRPLETEWWVMLLVSKGLIVQRRCLLWDAYGACPAPDSVLESAVSLVLACNGHRPYQVVSVRRHHHRWHLPSLERLQRFSRLLDQFRVQQVPLRNHLVLDSTGEIKSWRPQSSGSSGVSLAIVAPCCSTISMASALFDNVSIHFC